MNNTPQISVLMPAYNAEQYLREAIDSVLAQTFTDFEFIIINDGSTDQTEEIILSYADPRIVYVKNEVNLKLIKTLNKGIDLAKGKYIARMDADDICMPERFAVQYKFMEENQDVEACSSQMYLLIGDKISKSTALPKLSPVGCRFCAMFIAPFSHPATFLKASILKQFKYTECDGYLHIEDFVLWSDFALAGINMVRTDDFLLKYRVNPSGINRSYTEQQRENHAKRAHLVINEMLDIDHDIKLVVNVFSKKANSIQDIYSSLNFLDEVSHKYIDQNELCPTDIKEINLVLKAVKRNILKAKFKKSNLAIKLFIAFRYCIL